MSLNSLRLIKTIKIIPTTVIASLRSIYKIPTKIDGQGIDYKELANNVNGRISGIKFSLTSAKTIDLWK